MDWKAFFDGLLVLVLGVLGWIAAKKGFKDGGKPASLADLPKPPISGATVTTTTFTDDADIVAIKQLTGEISGLAYAQTEQAEATKTLVSAIKDTGEKAEEAIADLTEQVRELRQELSRTRR